MAYTHSDESEVDEGKKVDVTITKSAVSPGLINVPAETSQEDLTKELHNDRPAVDQQEPPQIANPVEDLPDATHNSRDPHEPPPEPPHHDPHEGVQQDPHKNDPPRNRELQHEVVPDRRYNNREVDPLRELHREGIPDRHEGDPPREPHCEVIPDRRDNPHEGDPLRNSHEPWDTFRRDPRDPLPDPWQPLHGHSREPWYMQDPMRRDHELNDRDALHPRDAFYYHDTRNLRYTGLQAPDHYGPEPHTDSEFTGRDSSPASELHCDALYGHGECERTYPSCYSPVLGPDYGREGGYARHDDLDERRAFGGGAYRDSGYPQARARYHDSRWTDHVRNVDTASADYYLRAFNHESTNPPRPPQ
ncbi:hypothetical protein EV702DRAFT_1197491 [Suillus placidus]|uniref:Uncharacterized protein n=1 Tax=Suillus placidus TaxID=48579 RepID=A0A9P6ZVT0_9AGAM|nr:hypothetical protein EV702DRAFT_1197491 [Suillus placidus]